MSYLLDTSVLLFWAMGREERLSPAQRSAIRNGANEVFVSAISAAEIRIKVSIGKLSAPVGIFDSLSERGLVELPLTIADSETLVSLPLLHRDPFDRLLIAQAVSHGLTLITTDERMREYPVATL